MDSEIQTTSLRYLFTKSKVSKENINIVFADNQEYRFAWIPIDKNGDIVEVDDDPILIRTNPFFLLLVGELTCEN